MRFAPLLVLLLVTAGVAGFRVARVVPDPIYRVASGSMAPHLSGPHVDFTCQECQFRSMLDAAVELPAEATCPNCGSTGPLTDAEILPGSALRWEAVPADQLRRFDLVVIAGPTIDTPYMVKRIAFLPGETPRIAQGELQRGGSLLRKTPREREALKLLVYDQSHPGGEFERFLSERISGSGWDIRPGSIGYVPLAERRQAGPDPLIYHHRSCLPPPSPSDRDAAPKDSYAYNHSVSRELFPANDLWLEWRFRHWKANAIVLTLRGKDSNASIRIDTSQQTVRAESAVGSVELPLEINSLQGFTARAGQCDGKLFLELERLGRHLRFPLVASEVELSAQPFAIAIEGGPAVLREPKVYRDIVWLGAQRRTDAWSLERKLSPHEIFVLGDNVPISDDSRFELGPIDVRKHLRGKVLRVVAE
ncbi:hypothetical protein [Blastopirellula marina]|nr:hypothetical protein [Blastopirellula marina]